MTMLELEVKAALSDDALERLQRLHLPLVDRQIQVDTCYKHACTDFVATDEAIRIRHAEGTTTVTYKGPRLSRDTKMREEHELVVNNVHEARAILERLGFTPVATVEKTRERYKRDDMCVMIDDVQGLGRFLEVEMLVEEQIEHAEARIFHFLDDLGISRASTIRDSYLELLNKA